MSASRWSPCSPRAGISPRTRLPRPHRNCVRAAAHQIDPELAAQTDAPLLHDEAGTNMLVEREFSRGDVDAELARAPIRVGGRFKVSSKGASCARKPRHASPEYDRGRRTPTLTSSTQIPGSSVMLSPTYCRCRGTVSSVQDGFGRRRRFGGKASVYPEEILVAVLARRLETSRCAGPAIDSKTSPRRPRASTRSPMPNSGLDSDGRILALSAEAIGDVGAYSIYPWTAALEFPVQVVSFLPGPYRVPAAPTADMWRAPSRTNKTPMGPYGGSARGRSRPL